MERRAIRVSLEQKLMIFVLNFFQLGKWQHACEVPTAEDILSDPSSSKYTKEVDDALSPHKKVLTSLLFQLDGLENQNIPIKRWLESEQKSLTKTIIPYVGTLSIAERAQVSNWFEVNVAKKKSFRSKWLGLLPIAHALTIFIAFRMERNTESRYPERKYHPRDYLEEAWEVQFRSTKSGYSEVDVERECLERLEEQMFERSLRAGIAGYCQWGLDAGDHQECWYPYAGLPEHWNHEDRENEEGELEVSTRSQFSNSEAMIQVLTKTLVDSVDRSSSQPNSLLR